MKKTTFLVICALFLIITNTNATDITSTVTSNTTWTAAGSPYIIINSIEVNPGVTLTIENGVEVKFNSGRYFHVRGTMNASGVKFTGNAGVTKGFWDGIYVSYEYYETGNVNLTNCTVEYASNIYLRKGQLTLNGCLVNNLSGSIRISNQGTLNIDNTTVSNTNFPISYYGAGVINPGSNLTFTNNVYNYVDIDFYNVEQEWRLKNFGLPYFNDNSIGIYAGAKWIIEPGVNIHMNTTVIETHGGKVNAIGTKDKPVVFDKYPSATYWRGFYFYDGAIDTACVLRNCVLKNASYDYEWYAALRISNASVTIDSCLFENNAYNLSIEGKSNPVISNCTFKPTTVVNGEARNITMDMNANPEFVNDSLQFNSAEIRAIRLRETTVTKKNTRLKKLNFVGTNNISYCLYNTTTIHDTASVIIDPGVVIKWRYHYSYIMGNGKITAIGTDAEPIVFTHLGDDNYGNPLDSQNDGTQTPGNSNAGRIMLYSTQESRLEKCKILYGGYDSNNWAVYISNANVVNNCEIKNSYRGILFTKNTKITNNSFTNIPHYTIGYALSTGTPDISGNTTSNIGYKGIYLDGSVTNDSPTLKKMNFAGFTNLPYILTSPFTIAQNNIVTIEPGIVLKFHNYGNQGILVNGALKAIGTKTEKIIFTSIQDDSAGGDTNNNGTGSVPGNSDWYGISFGGSASDDDNILRNCEVRYSHNTYNGFWAYAPIGITDCRVVLDSVKINFAGHCGIGIFGNANPEIKNTSFWNIAWEPVYMDMFANPKFDENNTLANVANIALKLRPGVLSGTVPKRSFAGYNPITYAWFDDALTVNSELTIPAGLTFKGYGRWNISGKLNILGTADNPVVFTTAEDDAYGNPKDGQQNGQAGYNQHSNYFVFYDSSNDSSVIENTIFRYSYQVPIQLNNASPTIRNCKFDNFSKIAISLAGNSAPAINNCIFNNVSYPFNTSLLSYPSSTLGNVMTGSTGRAIRINDETLTLDANLTKRAFGGINNIPYVFKNYTVGTAAKLTIEPGVVVKFEDYGYINVQNGLIANGGNSTDSAIIFTSARDDFYGGDTYNNGTADAPWNYAWQGIYFYNESIDESCKLKNCIIKWGSYPDSRGAVTLDNASPTIQNCRFEKGYHGVMCYNTSLPTITDCDFIDTEYNNGYAVWNKNSVTTVTAENCYFNSNTGPRHSTNLLGTGTRVSDYVDFIPFKNFMGKAELGDVSLNGTITAYDASLVLQHTVSNITLTQTQQNVADITTNGAITAYDASLILQYNVGLILTFTPNPSLIRMNAPAVASADILLGNITPSANKGEFIVPVYLKTGSGVKSLDLLLGFNYEHISLSRVSTANLNSNISFANSENVSNGKLQLSLTSAYDLDLTNGIIYLTFKINNSGIDQSEIFVKNAFANEDIISESILPLTVQTRIISSLDNSYSNKPFKVFVTKNDIRIDLINSSTDDKILISIADVSGRIIYGNKFDATNRIQIPFSELDNILNGVYLIQVNTGSKSFSGKLVINRN